MSLRAWPFYFVRPFSCTALVLAKLFAVGSLPCAALVAMLTTEIEASRYPLSARIVMLKRIRVKLRGEDLSVQPARPKPLRR